MEMLSSLIHNHFHVLFIQIPMMVKIDTVPYYEDRFVKVIKMPYEGEGVEMIFMLPKTHLGLSNFLKKLTGGDLLKYNLLNNTTIRRTEVKCN